MSDIYDDFITEGRKMLSISQSRVCYGEDESIAAENVWKALADLFSEEAPDTGLLCALPDFVGDASEFVDAEVVGPLTKMGFGDRIEVVSYQVAKGAPFPAFRVLISPSAPPTEGAPSEKDPMSLFE